MAVAAEAVVEDAFPAKFAPLFKPAPYKIARGGRFSGKSWSFARALLLLAADSTPLFGEARALRVGCFREVQKSLKESVHELLTRQIVAMGMTDIYEPYRDEIRGRNGSKFVFSGLAQHTSESIKSYEGLDIAWVEEAQTVSRRSWDILTPTIRAEGAEIWATFNPELDTDEVWARYVEDPPDGCVNIVVTYADNPFLTSTAEHDRQNFLRMVEAGRRTQEDYDNIYEGKLRSAVQGAIYAREVTAAKLAKRLTNVPYDPLLPVHQIWDLGFSDYMAILCVQRVASEVRIIRYVEDQLRTYESYANELNSFGYRWGSIWLPHDGRSRSPESGRSAQDIVSKLFDKEVQIVEDIGLENGIKAARQMWPRVYFDKDNAGQLFNRLGRYKRRINPQTQQGGQPLHDENSHGADGYRYLSVVEPQLINDTKPAFVDVNAAWR